MSISASVMVGYLRAEFAKAARLRVWMFVLQICVAAPAAISIVVTNVITTYLLAIASVFLLVVWWAVNIRYTAARNAANSARRAALILGGLEQSLSPNEIMSLRRRLTVSEATARKYEKGDYYATTLPVGSGRLGEMLEESAFYSADLHRGSSLAMLILISIFSSITCVVAVFAVPIVEKPTLLTIVRVGLAVIVFAMSSDVLGAYISHKSAARAIEDVQTRLTSADRSDYPIADVLLAMTDYNAAVESTPEAVPFIYHYRENELNRRWAEYKTDRENARQLRNGLSSP